MVEDASPRWLTPALLCFAGPLAGALVGAAANAIDDCISSDYFAIVMGWDGTHSILLAVAQGIFAGAALGLFFGFFLAITSAASTRLRCPPRLALRMLGAAMTVVLASWVTGGIIGVMWAMMVPQMWGFFFVGVPPRVNLPRFAWVGGTICGAYGGTVLALIVWSIELHRRWRAMNTPIGGFPVGE
jgi:hypothetical protein